jgi:RNA polymerase sigma-70 factor (sigma-E family)
MDGVVVGDVTNHDVTDHPVTFEEWVESRSRALTRFAYLLTGNSHEAEDALQSALTSAYAKWPRIGRTDDPEAYVRRMIVNAHVSIWRAFRRREQPMAEPRSEIGYDDVPPDGEADRVWLLCAALPARQRAAVVLRFYEDLSYREIAGVLDVSEATVRSHIHRALAALRQSIEEEHDER